MKFVHIADVHLDMPFTSLKNNKELVKRRKLEQKFIFRKTIDLVKEKEVEVLFIAGDLFEDKFVEDDTIRYIISCLEEINNVKVYITPGNHDPLIKSSPYNTFEWPDNVFIFGNEIGMDSFDDINIYGLGFDNFELDTDVIKEIELEEGKVNILVTHANLDGSSHKYHDIKSQWLTKFDYVALGHIHMPKIDKTKIIYPGSLIAGGFDEPGAHGLVLGEITKAKLKMEFIKMDDTQLKHWLTDGINYVINTKYLNKNTFRYIIPIPLANLFNPPTIRTFLKLLSFAGFAIVSLIVTFLSSIIGLYVFILINISIKAIKNIVTNNTINPYSS